jgi:acetyltransferase-like isoleucine patch superfamily enzyme
MTAPPLAWSAPADSSLKAAAKRLLDGLCTLLVLPLFVQTRLLALVLTRDQSFQLASQALSLAPGVPGNYLRKAFYRLTLPRCAGDVCLEFGTVLHQPTVELGRRVYVGPNCSIGECVIEDDVLIGSNVDIISGKGQHVFDDPDTPIREQGGRLEKIVVGPDCWIGNSSVVMASVGARSVVAAGSVVTRAVEPRSIVAGNPARLVRMR